MNRWEQYRAKPSAEVSQVLKPAKRKKLKKTQGRFVKGPIPATWLEEAARLPGRAFHVAVMIRYLDGFQGTGTVTLKTEVQEAYGLDRFACWRALKQLEAARLITANLKRGKLPRVTIREIVAETPEE